MGDISAQFIAFKQETTREIQRLKDELAEQQNANASLRKELALVQKTLNSLIRARVEGKLLSVDCPGFRFDPSYKGPDIIIQDDGLCVSKDTGGWRSVLGTITFTEGRHYWEMKILKLNAFIGVAVTIPDRMFDVAKCCGDETETSFGWCWDGDTKGLGSTVRWSSALCAPSFHNNDTVGLLLDMTRDHEHELHLFVNGLYGCTVKLPPFPSWTPCVSLGCDSQVCIMDDVHVPTSALPVLHAGCIPIPASGEGTSSSTTAS